MKNNNTLHSIFIPLPIIGLLFFIFTFSKCQTNNENVNHQKDLLLENRTTSLKGINAIDVKQKGAHIFGHLDSANLQPFIQNNIKWIALVPYGGQKDFDSSTVEYHREDSLRMIHTLLPMESG